MASREFNIQPLAGTEFCEGYKDLAPLKSLPGHLWVADEGTAWGLGSFLEEKAPTHESMDLGEEMTATIYDYNSQRYVHLYDNGFEAVFASLEAFRALEAEFLNWEGKAHD